MEVSKRKGPKARNGEREREAITELISSFVRPTDGRTRTDEEASCREVNGLGRRRLADPVPPKPQPFLESPRSNNQRHIFTYATTRSTTDHVP